MSDLMFTFMPKNKLIESVKNLQSEVANKDKLYKVLKDDFARISDIATKEISENIKLQSRNALLEGELKMFGEIISESLDHAGLNEVSDNEAGAYYRNV